MDQQVKISRRFADFTEDIKKLSTSGPSEEELQRFLLFESGGRVRMYYAPFDWINPQARVIIVGITPGRNSMINAFRAAASALRQGSTIDESSKQGKRAGSFSNMRSNIARMFDDLNLPQALGIHQSGDLFNTEYDLLHPTSCIRYPVLVWSKKKGKWDNYTGHNPKLLKWDIFMYFIENVLADELKQFPDALIVPCGKAVDGALRHLSAKGMVNPSRCLFGFPHASPANGHRKRQFNEQKDQLRQKVAEWGIRS